MIELLLQAERALSVGMLDRAETLYRQVYAADPRNSIAVVGLARVALERGDEDESLALGKRALQIDPENAAAQRLVQRLEEVRAYRSFEAGQGSSIAAAPVPGSGSRPPPDIDGEFVPDRPTEIPGGPEPEESAPDRPTEIPGGSAAVPEPAPASAIGHEPAPEPAPELALAREESAPDRPKEIAAAPEPERSAPDRPTEIAEEPAPAPASAVGHEAAPAPAPVPERAPAPERSAPDRPKDIAGAPEPERSARNRPTEIADEPKPAPDVAAAPPAPPRPPEPERPRGRIRVWLDRLFRRR